MEERMKMWMKERQREKIEWIEKSKKVKTKTEEKKLEYQKKKKSLSMLKKNDSGVDLKKIGYSK